MASQKRPHGTGRVEQLPSGSWRARYRLGGKPQTKTFKSEDAAHAYLDALFCSKGARSGDLTGADPLNAWIDQWLMRPRKRRRKTATGETSKRQPKTDQGYASTFDNYVRPYLGATPVMEIDRFVIEDFQETLDELLEDHPDANLKAQKYTKWVLDSALFIGAIAGNPYRHPKVSLPDGSGRRPPIEIEREDVFLLSEAIHSHYRFVPVFTAYTGLRAGELWALRCKSIDLKRNRVRVTNSVGEVKGNGLVLGPTKNGKPRTVPIPGFLHEMIGEHMEERKGGPDDWLFVSPRGMQVRHNNFSRNAWRPARVKSGVNPKVRFHDLRHFFAHLHLSAGIEIHELQDLMGHSSITVTKDTYGGYFERHHERIVAVIDADHERWLNEQDEDSRVVPIRKGA